MIYIQPLIIAVMALAWVKVVTAYEGPLEKLDNFLYVRIPSWLYKPLLGCAKCNAGQIALWYFIFEYGFSIALFPFVLTSIFFAAIIDGFDLL